MGGVNGHPVSVVAVADQGTGSGALAAARQLIQQNKVQALMFDGPTAENAAAAYVSGTGIPVVGNFPSGGDSVGLSAAGAWPNQWFTTAAAVQDDVLNWLTAVKASGAKSVSSVFCSESPACVGAAGVLKGGAPAYGLSYKGTLTAAAGQASYTPQCLQLKSSGTQSVALAAFAQADLPIMTQCQQQGLTASYFLPASIIDPPTMQGHAKGTIWTADTTFPWWVNAKPVEDYRAVMKQYSPGTNYGFESASGAWAALQLFRQALGQYGPAASSPVTADAVKAAYHKVKGETLGGLLPAPITYAATGTQPQVPCVWIAKYSPGAASADGAFTVVPNSGTSGNGVSGQLSTWCVKH
jgi:branched-chain amino acid transport system substrate-binding protein